MVTSRTYVQNRARPQDQECIGGLGKRRRMYSGTHEVPRRRQTPYHTGKTCYTSSCISIFFANSPIYVECSPSETIIPNKICHHRRVILARIQGANLVIGDGRSKSWAQRGYKHLANAGIEGRPKRPIILHVANQNGGL